MTRAEALAAAEKYIAETVPTDPPKNERGYPINGWRQPDPAERLRLVLEVARFLLVEEMV